MLLNSYFAAHRFDDVVSAYGTMPIKFRGDYLCRHMNLIASANLRQVEVIAETIKEVLSERESIAASEFLSKALPFAEKLGSEIHSAAVQRVVKHASHLAVDHFDTILKCAHDLREKGWEAGALGLERALRHGAGSARNRMKLDLLDAQIHFWNRRFDLQLAAVNGLLERQGVLPIGLKNMSQPVACENLQATPEPRPTISGPLVSILMPAFNSASTVGYALESLRRQTYQNIEVIVVDDFSDDATADIVMRICAADQRLRLISLEKNSGVFVARNTGLAAARGELVTNQDADDWAHPQKIEVAVSELQRQPSIVATWVEHIRCSDQRGFRALSGYFRPDASSLMYRRVPVMSTIGWYDSVRAAGDGEFHLRMERAFGHNSIQRINKLLSFVSWSDASLSGGGLFQIDNDLGIFSPARSEYRRAFGLWHETTDRLYMPFPLNDRPFPIPESLLST
ncbi:glycosyltransferase family 2 protein [Microvirga soli]|uniref:glycosyltransferase family 2 protein n=1 Tax=Microvirga soli TaxID=1854496 RepID=UPI00191F0A56|nr:glycosyltransferase family 2 protein [Microvirga soli]